MLRIGLQNFWPGAFQGDFLRNFLDFATARQYVLVNDVHSADLVLSSVFGREPTLPDRTIQFIWENVRPSMFDSQFSLSFDYDTYGGRNFYLPLWYTCIRWPGFEYQKAVNADLNHGHEPLVDLSVLLNSRVWSGRRRKFCAFVANNINSIRLNLYTNLSAIEPLEGRGGGFGEPLVGSKLEYLEHFDFCLCPENSIYPGYITEKIVHAYVGGCVPLYYGDLSRDYFLNKDACINYFDDLETSRFIYRVMQARGDDRLYREIYERPLLIKRPSLDEPIAFFRSAVSAIVRR